MFIGWILLIIAPFCLSANTCTILNFDTPQSSLLNPCTQVVNYEFFLPQGSSQDFLNQIVLTRLSNPALPLLPPSCQASLLALICTSVYLKCMPDVDLLNMATWNFHLYQQIGVMFPVPFQQPCGDLCTNVNHQCIGLLSLLGQPVDCSSNFDYSFGYRNVSLPKPPQYDFGADQSFCNDGNSGVAVAGTMEPYLYAAGGGVCSGIVTKLYVPPGNLVSPFLGPMQRPFVVQSFIESGLASELKLLPPWLSPECRFAMREYFCSNYMLQPQIQVIGNLLGQATGYSHQQLFGAISAVGLNATLILSHSFFAPQYPAPTLCQQYSHVCAPLIASAGVSALIANCSAVSSKNAQTSLFPVKDQVVASLPLSLLGMSFTVRVITSPAIFPSATDTSGYQANCPRGFVIPSEPLNDLNLWIPGSGCAVACR